MNEQEIYKKQDIESYRIQNESISAKLLKHKTPITMKPNEAFRNWYDTEGTRTPAYPVEGETSLHEEYARIAFQGGYKAAIDYCAAVVDKVGTELGKTS